MTSGDCRMKCLHFNSGSGYEEHSYCTYGYYFKPIEECKEFVDKKIKKDVKKSHIKEFLSYIQETVDEIRVQCKQVEKFMEIIVKNYI